MVNNLIPIYLYQGHQVGRPERLYDYVLAEQGVIKRLETAFVSVDHLLVPIREKLIGLRLARYPLQPLRLKVPRLPARLLGEVVETFRAQLDREVMAHFRYDQQGWQVTYPAQDQSRARVGYTAGDPSTIVLDLHSHHTMAAFFSGTDDRDEQGARFYAVLGRLDQPHPELILRLGLYGHWLRNIPANLLFEGIGPCLEVYDEVGLPPEDFARVPGAGLDQKVSPGWLARLFNRRDR